MSEIDILKFIPRHGLERVGLITIEGAKKHGGYDPLPVSERMAKIRRHWRKYADGDREEDHFAAIAANALFAMEEEFRIMRDAEWKNPEIGTRLRCYRCTAIYGYKEIPRGEQEGKQP